LEQIKGAIEAARVQALPSSALAKGCNYTLTLWDRLTDQPRRESQEFCFRRSLNPGRGSD
jgi:hypothetical protein